MLNKQILNNAQLVIDSRRKQAERLSNSFMSKALENKEFKQNFEQKKEAEFENARCEVYGEKPKHDIKKFEKIEAEILKKLKINPKNLIPAYTCKKCNDTGYINSSMCACLKKEINEQLFIVSGFKKDLQTFDKCNFELFDNKEKMQTLYTSMEKWCTKESDYKIIMLTGKTGVGKTHLTECMASKLIENENIVLFISAFNFNQNLLKFHTTFDETKVNYINTLLDPEYLFIDDLGTEAIFKNVTIEGLYNVISDRLANNKKTIITTNLGLKEIEETYGERLFSRFLNRKTSLIFNMTEIDLRLKK